MTKSQFNITILSFIPALPESGESKLHRDREDKKMDAQFRGNVKIPFLWPQTNHKGWQT